jgi:hypothetical protein
MGASKLVEFLLPEDRDVVLCEDRCRTAIRTTSSPINARCHEPVIFMSVPSN